MWTLMLTLIMVYLSESMYATVCATVRENKRGMKRMTTPATANHKTWLL